MLDFTHNLPNILHQMGLKSKDSLCVHSSLMHFYTPDISPFAMLKDMQTALLKSTAHGNLLVPTFSYSFFRDDIYDKALSPCLVGALGESMRRLKNSKRSDCPIFSFAVFGERADRFLKQGQSCMGQGCGYDTLANENGKLLIMGDALIGFTFWLYVEELAKVEYRYFKEFTGLIKDENGIIKQKQIRYFVRDLSAIKNQTNRAKRFEFFKSLKSFKHNKIKNADLILIEAAELREKGVSLLKNNNFTLL